MNILIIEDEPLVARDIQNLLSRIDADVSVIGILSSIDESRKWFNTNAEPDLIVSDIQLSDGVSFEIFETLHVRCPIIFTTAYDDYAIRAFKLNSIDYLLKPIDATEFTAALNKYIFLIQAVAKVKTTHKGLTLVLKGQGNVEVDISREKATAFKKWLG